MKRIRAVSAVIMVTVISILLSSCYRNRDVILNELKQLELSDHEKHDLDHKTEKELLEGIRFLEKEVNRTVNAGAHLGTYYKMVAIKYRDRNLYGLASEYFEKALGIYPANPYLAYWAGVCAGKRSQAEVTPETKLPFIDKARDYYLYAIELDPRYTDALYGLSVLYVFEYKEPRKAETYLERILAIESYHFRAMFLLARVYVTYGRISDAVALYNRIIADSKLDSMVTQATANRDALEAGNAR